MSHACYACGRLEQPKLVELRPYGPGGALICFPCAMKPEHLAQTERQFDRALDAAEEASRADASPVVLTTRGPRSLDEAIAASASPMLVVGVIPAPKPTARHDLTPDKFPFTIKLVSGTTGEVVWSRTVTIDEARNIAKVEIPSFAGSDHYPVRAEITYADGTTEVQGMQ